MDRRAKLIGCRGRKGQRRFRLRDFLPAAGMPVDRERLDAVFEGYLTEYERSWQAYEDAGTGVLGGHLVEQRLAATGCQMDRLAIRCGRTTCGFQLLNDEDDT